MRGSDDAIFDDVTPNERFPVLAQFTSRALLTGALITGTLLIGLSKSALAAPTERDLAILQRQLLQADELIGEDCPAYTPPPMLRLLKSLPTENLCQGRGTSLVALTDIQVVYLCKNDQPVANYDFSLGFMGLNKRREGDLKTPVGTYTLGPPKQSDRFGIFMPIGYPTLEQKRRGYTGSDVGLHGPKRAARCAGFLNVAVNWTQGCLAVASDIFIKEIAKFVVNNKVRQITILPSGGGFLDDGPKAVPSAGPDPDSRPR